MGVDTKRPPLPAPTDSGTDTAVDDVETDVSRLTDQTSYSVPDDGSPITISTKKSRKKDSNDTKPNDSQTSLLIEYFEGGRPKDKTSSSTSRPSVRVRVTPSSKKTKGEDAVQITEYGKDRKPSYTRRISLSGRGADQSGSRAIAATEMSKAPTSDSPVQVDTQQNQSDVSSFVSNPHIMPAASDISSMPADSMLDGPITFKTPKKPEKEKLTAQEATNDSLKAPPRTRSISRERILRKAAEKVNQESRAEESAGKQRVQRAQDKTRSREVEDDAYEDYKARSRRSSKTQSRPESGDYRSGVESSYLRHRDGDSNVSSASKSSLANNPRLLQTVEDAIRRMILPEIDEIKRRQTISQSEREDRERDRSSPGGTTSRDKVKHRKERRSSRDTDDHASKEERRERRRKSGESRRSSGTSEGLTTAALKDHNARSKERERRERRKQRSKSESENESVPTTDESYDRSKIPPMPMRSDVGDSDLTRESILSAETGESNNDRPSTGDSRALPAIQEVKRGSGPAVPVSDSRSLTQTSAPLESHMRTSTQTDTLTSPRSRASRGELKSERSTSKARDAALAAAGLGGAAGAMYNIGRYKADRSRSRDLAKSATDKREASPAQSVSSYRSNEVLDTGRSVDQTERPLTRDSKDTANIREVVSNSQSIESMGSDKNVRYPITQKRHQPVSLEEGQEILDQNVDIPAGISNTQVEDDFYKEQERVNDEYRSIGDDERAETTTFDPKQPSTVASPQNTRDASAPQDQLISPAGANAEMVGSPARAESEVASLLDQSQTSSFNSPENAARDLNDQTLLEQQGATPANPRDISKDEIEHELRSEHSNPSQDRWAALRENAKALSNSKESLDADSPPQSETRSIRSEERVHMGTSGLPNADDPMPEIGHGVDMDSESTTEPSLKREPSVLEEPLGNAAENRDHWPYEPTPPTNKRQNLAVTEDRDEPYISAGNAALNGAFAGLGIGGGAATAAGATRDTQLDSEPSLREIPSESSNSAASMRKRDLPQGTATNHGTYDGAATMNTPGYFKDEGYISAAQARSPDDFTPLSFSKPPPRLFDEKDVGMYQRNMPGADPFVTEKKARYLSGNSHGMSSPQFDASTGKGINGIQSKDVVALMDHLTVRDGQRNARDTEILVTLVRSATETRNAFDDMKKLIENGQLATMSHTDKGISRVLNAPRPQVLGSPRYPQSTEDLPGKKKNIFKRALGGLSSKSNNDLSRIEDMLNHLLDEVETLKGAQTSAQGDNLDRGPSIAPRASLDSYEQMRAAPESGYEPSGQAGTSSTPNQSGYFSPPTRQMQPGMHSGYSASRDKDKRVSTVLEGDEEAEDPNGVTTPTQETPQLRSSGTTIFDMTPLRQSNDYRGSIEITPPSDERQRHRSTNSSGWGVPRISRWSKTTASSDNRTSIETTPGRRDLPYSDESRSGSDINVLPPPGQPWITSEDDRLRSADSLARAEGRPSSPLASNPTASATARLVAEDPKYQANRKSLTLEHPQPRQGSTRRHQSHLENQAYAYGDEVEDPRENGENYDNEMTSPTSDTLGSVPSLSRLPNNARANPLTATQQQHSNDPAQSPVSSASSTRNTAIRGPPGPPEVPRSQSREMETYSNDSPIQDDESFGDIPYDDEDWSEDPAIPLPRKVSPYSPGGLLAPIEERYSLEGDRSSLGYSLSQKSQKSQRDSMDARYASGAFSSTTNSAAGTAHNSLDLGYAAQSQPPAQYALANMTANVVEIRNEAVNRAASGSPVTSARPALGAPDAMVRKLTGPRDMPRKTSGDAGAPDGLRGTVRRKPMSGAFGSPGVE